MERIDQHEENEGKEERLTVAMGAVDHDGRRIVRPGFGHSLADKPDGLRVVVGLRAAPSEDDVDVDVARSLDDTGQALVVDAEKGVGTVGRAHRIDRHTHSPICPVLEPNRMRRPRC